MKRKFMDWAVVTAAAVLAALGPARADLSWETKGQAFLTIGGGETVVQSSKSSFSLKQNVVRIDEAEVNGARFINFQNQTGVIVSFEERTFTVWPLTELIAMERNSEEELKQDLPNREITLTTMQGEEKEIYAAQIEAQKIIFDLWSKPYQVRATTERGEVLGHQCVKYEGLSGDKVFQEIWVAEDIVLDPFYKTYFAPGMGRFDPQEYGHLPLVPGFPMKVINRYGLVRVVTEVTHVTDSLIPAEAFTLPEDLIESPLVNRPPQ